MIAFRFPAHVRHEAKRRNQRFVGMAVEGRRDEAHELIQAAEDFLEKAVVCGLDRAYLSDTARGFRDAICNLEHAMNKDLDEAGLDGDVALDLSTLDEIIAAIDGS